MTLREQIAADCSAVFLVTADFGVTIDHMRGDFIEQIVAVVDIEEPMVDSPGRNLRVHRKGTLDCLKTVDVRIVQAGGKPPSTFTIDGELWAAESVDSTPDDAMQTVHIVRVDKKATVSR